ncbi:MAG: hypothetical protein IJX77_08070 [Ruminococcus sp.]|nr:hypothetical protein [Ruminococcus sp.]
MYLPELNSLVASGLSEQCRGGITSRYFDAGRILTGDFSGVEEIVGYTMEQSREYAERSQELISIADLLLREYIGSVSDNLRTDSLKSYTVRKVKSLLGKCGKEGRESARAVSAITCNGYRFGKLPEDWKVIRLKDDHIAASRVFVKMASKTANKLGHDTMVSHSVDSENAPLHLLIPGIRTAFISESDILKTKFTDTPKINLNRFYGSALLASCNCRGAFFGEYIRKIYCESVLYARIGSDLKNQGRRLLLPYISEKAAAEIASEIVYGILNT